MRVPERVACLAFVVAAACSSQSTGASLTELSSESRLTSLERDFAFSFPKKHKQGSVVTIVASHRADEPTMLRMRSSHSNMELGFTPANASSAAREGVRGVAIFRNAFGSGTDLLRTELSDGVEEFIAFETPPEEERLRYDLTLHGVAGLRLVHDVLELLEDDGTPRLRVTAPWVRDARGVMTRVHLALEGCAFDSSARAPWGRPVIAPGSGCRLVLAWHAESYPALVDPSWLGTRAMIDAREQHSAVALPSGRILVAGGTIGSGFSEATTMAEVYDPSSGTFTITGSMTTARVSHTANTLSTGDVVFVGGEGTSGVALPSTEIYSEVTGLFTAGPRLLDARMHHTATTFGSGAVLVTGGSKGTGALASAEIYEPTTNSMRATGSLAVARMAHQAILLSTGRVLVVAGSATPSAEIYDPVSGTFSPTHAPPIAAAHSANGFGVDSALFSDGETTAIFHATTSTFEKGPSLINGRGNGFTATSLASGSIVFTGGEKTGPSPLSAAERFDARRSTMGTLPSMASERTLHAAARLADGAILVVGGDTLAGEYRTNTAEILTIRSYGTPCTAGDASDCEGDGVCVDGVCCTSACDQQCQACNEPGNEGTCVTVTGTPRGNRTGCVPAGKGIHAACAETCDGVNPLTCVYPGDDKLCDSSCDNATLTSGLCNGAGLCGQGAPRACDNHLVCADAKACRTTCAEPADCLAGYLCAAGTCSSQSQCTDDYTVQSAADGHVESCAPFKCNPAAGSCRTTCETVDDCAAPTVCSPDHVCVYVSDGADGGCVVASGATTDASGLLLAVAAALGTRRRRRTTT